MHEGIVACCKERVPPSQAFNLLRNGTAACLSMGSKVHSKDFAPQALVPEHNVDILLQASVAGC